MDCGTVVFGVAVVWGITIVLISIFGKKGDDDAINASLDV